MTLIEGKGVISLVRKSRLHNVKVKTESVSKNKFWSRNRPAFSKKVRSVALEKYRFLHALCYPACSKLTIVFLKVKKLNCTKGKGC